MLGKPLTECLTHAERVKQPLGELGKWHEASHSPAPATDRAHDHFRLITPFRFFPHSDSTALQARSINGHVRVNPPWRLIHVFPPFLEPTRLS